MFLGFLQLFRPLNLLLGALAIVISSSILEVEVPFIILQTVFVVIILNAAANAFNDYMDSETDKINRPDRPIPKGAISKMTALIAAILLFVAGITLSAFLNSDAFIIASLITVPLMIAYSLWFKGWPLFGNIVVALILGLTFIFAGAAFGNLWGLIVPALLAFGFTLLRELVKDIADLEGDRSAGLRTFPVLAGEKKSAILAIILSAMIGAGALIPYFLEFYGLKYLIILIFGIEFPLFYVLLTLVKSPTITNCKRIAQILKACIIVGLLAVYLG
jgi:4-hydroxybenzoate polyprenyltransferase